MAHNGAGSGDAVDPVTLPGKAIAPPEPDSVTDVGERASIDRLLALTDDGWDVDEQVRTLQREARDERTSRPPPGPATKPPVAGEQAPARPSRPPPLPAARKKKPPPLPRGASGPPRGAVRTGQSTAPPPRPVAPDAAGEPLAEILGARISVLESCGDSIGLARAHLELAIAGELGLADDAKASAHARAAIAANPDCAPAHALLRRSLRGRPALPTMIEHLEHELASATEAPGKAELLAERARLLDAAGGKADAARAAWEQALAHAPQHAAALKGLEVELFARVHGLRGETRDVQIAAAEALATHLAREADAYAADPRLAAWLHVERANVLERQLGNAGGARAALACALALDPGVGPVRASVVRHVAAHDDVSALVSLLDEEAHIERDPKRCARLELDAACCARDRLGDAPRAIALLERAARRAPTVPSVDRRVLDELVRLYEEASEWPAAARARRARLPHVAQPRARAFELRALAAIAESSGDLDTAISDARAAATADPADGTLVDLLDRLFDATGQQEERVALWVTDATRTDEPVRRTKALVRAARVADERLARPAEAVRHLRSAWVAAPGDPEILDSLARLLSPNPSEALDKDVRVLVDLFAQAEEHTRDPDRRIAYLERCALLWEDVLGDARRAARAYEDVLALAPGRRGAILGLERTARRAGDTNAHARALLDEARLTDDEVAALALQVRAAIALSAADPARALALVGEVLAKDPEQAEALALETRLHETAGRWELAAQTIAQTILHTPRRDDKVALWLALAQVQSVRMHTPDAALASLQAARALDPSHPAVPCEIARVLRVVGDATVHRAAIEELAQGAASPEERALYLVRAAEIDELVLRDDERAAAGYARALAATPDDELAAERLARVLARRATSDGPAALGALVAHQGKRAEHATNAQDARALSLDVAALLVAMNSDLARAGTLLESILSDEPGNIPALRLLEQIARRSNDPASVARALAQEGDALGDVRARLGALWSLAALEQWRLPSSDPSATYRRILAQGATDPFAIEATLRSDLPAARHGDAQAQRSVVTSLRSLSAIASDDASQLALQLRLAMALELFAGAASDAAATRREARDRYRAALRADPLSVTAATGLARLASTLGDAPGAFAAACALAELAAHPKARARALFDAGEILLSPAPDELLGTVEARRREAQTLFERALDADPELVAAAGRYATLCAELGEHERMVDVLRAALRGATSPDAVVMLGSTLAAVARDHLKNLPVAIDAMRRVREVAPANVPALLTLAELCVAQRVWPDAVDALHAVVAASREASPRLTALFALASIYERVLAKRPDAERALRAALEIDDRNPRALRGLLRFLGGSGGQAGPPAPARKEMAGLLERLADLERVPAAKCELLVELATLRTELGQPEPARQALVLAVAHAPGDAKVLARLAACFGAPGERDDLAYARALTSVIAFGQRIGRADAIWFATLGRLEVANLGTMREGIAHLRQAIELDGQLDETRFDLGAAYAHVEAHEDAVRTLAGMISPEPRRILGTSDPNVVLRVLEKELLGLQRSEDALTVSELRAIGGDLDEGRTAWLRSRRPPTDPARAMLDRPTLVTQVLPNVARHVLLEVAAAISGIETKILRADLAELGVSARDRVGARGGHPTRAVLDRLMRALGLEDIELVVTPNVRRTRVIAQDELWVVVPATLAEQPEPAQYAAIGRALCRIALGTPWLEELPPPHVEALLIAAARQTVPGYAADAIDVLSAKLVAQYEPTVQRALTRRQRRLLAELGPHISAPQGRPIPIEPFVVGLARGEIRGAYVLTGDLLAAVDDVRSSDPQLLLDTEQPGRASLTAVLGHTYAGDLCQFALSPEATALRRRVGATWTL